MAQRNFQAYGVNSLNSRGCGSSFLNRANTSAAAFVDGCFAHTIVHVSFCSKKISSAVKFPVEDMIVSIPVTASITDVFLPNVGVSFDGTDFSGRTKAGDSTT
jgi:hypothetical protein